MNTESAARAEPGLMSPQGRMSRLRYIAWSGGLSFLIAVAAGIVSALLSAVVPGLGMAVMAVGYLAVLVIVVMLTIKRCHDFNVTGWLALLLIVPLAALIFWIIPGTEDDNRFGPPPPPSSTGVQVVAWLIIGLAALCVIAAVVAPGMMMANMQPPG